MGGIFHLIYHKHNQAISLANQSIELISNHSAIIGEDLRFLNIKVELLHSLAIASHYLHDNDNSIKYCEQIIDIFQAIFSDICAHSARGDRARSFPTFGNDRLCPKIRSRASYF